VGPLFPGEQAGILGAEAVTGHKPIQPSVTMLRIDLLVPQHVVTRFPQNPPAPHLRRVFLAIEQVADLSCQRAVPKRS